MASMDESQTFHLGMSEGFKSIDMPKCTFIKEINKINKLYSVANAYKLHEK